MEIPLQQQAPTPVTPPPIESVAKPKTSAFIKFIRTFLLILIIIGLGLLGIQSLWVPKLVATILGSQDASTIPTEIATSTTPLPTNSGWIPIEASSSPTAYYPYSLENGQVSFGEYGPGVMPMVDVASFELEKDPSFAYAYPYARDKNNVYCDNAILTDADRNTFALIYTTYSKIDGAYSVRYAKDKNNVYSGCAIVTGADPATFVVLSDPRFTKDADHVWFDGIAITGADSATFTPLKDELGDTTFYAKDKNSVYKLGEQDGYATIIQGADPATFTPVIDETFADPNAQEGADEIMIAKDANHVYMYGTVIPGADPSTFTVLKDSNGDYSLYGKDKDSIYYLGAYAPAVMTVDYATFQVTSRTDAKDNSHTYSYGLVK